jgi:uncharacterized repeat protein (TIGR01451 family)
LEELESRTVPTTITRTSGSIFYNDLKNGLTSAYAAYQITNNDGVNYPDVQVTIGNFTAASGSSVVMLSPGLPGTPPAPDVIDLGPLANGQTKTAFFYLGSSADTNVTQTHTVSVYNGPPAPPALLTSQDFSFTSVQDTIQANANKVNSVVISPSQPTVGQTFTITVMGHTGTIGTSTTTFGSMPPVVDFTPAAYPSWRADALQLTTTTITLNSPNAGVFVDTLAIPPTAIISPADTSYTAVYTFKAVAPTGTDVPVSPTGYISSGNNVKHTDTGSFGSVTVPQVFATPTLVTTASPTTVTLTPDSFTTPPTLTDTADLEGGFNPTGTIVFTLTGPGGVVSTRTDPVSGNGMYTASIPLLTTGTVAGIYTWTASYDGDNNNKPARDQGGTAEQTVVNPASPTLVTTASPASVTLPLAAPLPLTDTADLEGGFAPTGSIVFTLRGPGGFSYTQTDTVGGNGTYTAATTLPTTAMAGTYTWMVTYNGDGNNNPAADQGGTVEQTVVGSPTLSLVTLASPLVSTLPAGPPGMVTLTDSAMLSGGQSPTGTILFTLTGPGGFSQTRTDMVSGNGTYMASITLPTPPPPTGMVAGTYTWTAHYSGDGTNPAADDQGGIAEQNVVRPASPTVVTTASPTEVMLTPDSVTNPPTLTDTATLSGGYFPTGNIVFTLTGPGGVVVGTQIDPVSGNRTYAAAITLPTPPMGTVAGTYTWTAHYSGDNNNKPANDPDRPQEQVTVIPASPTLVTTASPVSVTLPLAAPLPLTDTADLEGGFAPTGSIVFTLTGPGFSYTQTDTVGGNGTYTAGTTLPTTAMAGTYTWTASYKGDANNVATNDQSGTDEQTVLAPANLTLVTITSTDVTTLPAGPPGTLTLRDLAFLSGGQSPTGTILFTLTGPGGFLQTQTDTVSGNGTYAAAITLPTPPMGTVTGTYTWTAHYSGDPNNKPADDQRDTAEQTVVRPASPTVVTTTSPTEVTLPITAPVVLTDMADLEGGYYPTGSIVFTLTGPGGFSYTQTDTVSGNGTYTAGTTLPTAGAVAGIYTWTATYKGDGNNNGASDQGGFAEQTLVGLATPTITTTPNPTTAHLGATLQDSANLAGGYDPVGSITFRLYAPGVAPTVSPAAYTEIVGVNGNGTYHTTVGFAPPTTGIWNWVATYNGDSNNNSAASGPLDEPVTIPEQADLILDKQVDPTRVMIGFPAIYTFTLHNNGPDAATGVTVIDPFPSGVTVVGPNTPSQGTYDPVSGVWSVGTLPVGATATLTVTAQVEVLGPITNTAHAGADQFDPDLSNNLDAATLTGMRPPSMISKRFFLSGAAASDPAAATIPSKISSTSRLSSLSTLTTAPSTVVNALTTNTTASGSGGLLSAALSTVGNATGGTVPSVPVTSTLTSGGVSSSSSSDLPGDPTAEKLEQPSVVEPVSAVTLSDAVFDLPSAPPRPPDASPTRIPADVWEFLDLDADVNFEGLVSGELRSRVPARADVPGVGTPDRWDPSASLAAEGWGLGGLLGWSAFLGGMLREDELRRARSRCRRHTLHS